MNSFIDTLNHWGGRFADFALPMLVQSSVLIVLLFALDLVLRNRVRAVVRYVLWMLVLIKLVLPPSFSAPTSPAYWLSEKKAVKTPPSPSQHFVVRYSDVKFDGARPLPSFPPTRAKLQFAGWLLLGWLATAVGLLAWLVRRSRSVVQTAARAFPAPESPEQLLDAYRQQMGIKHRVRLKLSATASSPAVCGLWRPVILIPQQLADRLSALQLRAVLLHELSHIKRGDVWVHYAQTLLQICYWWHPLFWLANVQIRRVREQAVDEAVVVAMGSEAEAYPATLVEVAKLAIQRPALALGLIGIVESKSTLALRIQRLLDRPVPQSAKLGFTRLAAVALIGAVLLPMARGERKPGDLAAASTGGSLSRSAAIEVEVKFVSLTDAALENLLGFRPKTIAASGHFLWKFSPAERIELLQRMERQPDAATLSAPRVTTRSARQAQMTVEGIQPFLHPRARTSAACQVLPYQIGSSLDLAVSAKITESGDVGSAFGDDLSRNRKEDTNDARSGAKSNQLYAVNAVGYINYDVGTAHTFVGDGGAVILHNPALTGADGRRILVVVSPRVVRLSASLMEPNANAISVAASPSASHPSRDAMDTRRPPTNSPKNQLTNTLTSSEGQGATKRFASSSGQDIEIEAIKSGMMQYDPQTGICVVANDFVARFNGAVLTARSGQVNTKTGEVIAEGGVTLQRGDQVLRVERLQYNFIQQKVTDPNAPSVSTGAAPASVPVLGPGRKAIQAKLKQIILPEIVFDNLPLPEALRWLAKEASDRDPDGTGVNVLLNPNVIPAGPGTIIDPTTGQPVTLSSPQPLDINTVKVRINPPLKNVRLHDALEAIVKTSDKPIRYSIEEYAIVFSQNPTGTTHRETRIFRIDPKTFLEDAQRVLIAAGWSDVEIFGRSNDWKASLFRNFFESIGVSWVPPNTMFYSEGTGGLMVHASAEELDRVQKAIDALNALRQKESASQSGVLETARSLNIEPFTPKPSETIKLETRVFRLNPATLLEGLQNSSGVRTHFGTIASMQDSIRDFFAAAGVDVQPPNSLFYKDRTGVLMVRATSTDLDIVQKALETLNYRPAQITIEARIVEMPTETAGELGLDLPAPDDRRSNTWTRILTAAQTRAVLHAAEQHVGVDVLSAPKITSLSGRQAQIQVVETRTVLTGIDPKALAPPGVQSTKRDPAQPYLTSQVNCGPTMDVVATVGGDGYTIHLAALPQVTEFLRYDNTLKSAKETRVWVDGKQRNVPMPLPVIQTRQLQALVDVYDGQTLVLGRPSVTKVSQQLNGQSVTNAIPEDPEKRLLVFITPTIIDPAGNPIHMEGKEPFPADQPPPQQVQ